MQRVREILAWNLRFDGIRRHACTQSRRLITRRSQVQTLPPLPEKPRNRGFSRFWCDARARFASAVATGDTEHPREVEQLRREPWAERERSLRGFALRRVGSPRTIVWETRSLGPARPTRKTCPSTLPRQGPQPRACNCSQNSSCCIRCASHCRPMTVKSATGSRSRCSDDQPLSLPSLSSTRTIP
jgi:hypothetical protein